MPKIPTGKSWFSSMNTFTVILEKEQEPGMCTDATSLLHGAALNM